ERQREETSTTNKYECRLFDRQRDLQFLPRLLNRGHRLGSARVLGIGKLACHRAQELDRFLELGVGKLLWLAVALRLLLAGVWTMGRAGAQSMNRGADVLDGRGAMALVIVVCPLEEELDAGQFLDLHCERPGGSFRAGRRDKPDRCGSTPSLGCGKRSHERSKRRTEDLHEGAPCHKAFLSGVCSCTQ